MSLELDTLKKNHVLETGQEPIDSFERRVRDNAHAIRVIKFGSGAYRDGIDDIGERIQICRDAGIIPCLGGGVVEQACRENTLYRTVVDLHNMGLNHVEISNGALLLPTTAYRQLVRTLEPDFDGVFVEAGTKYCHSKEAMGKYASLQGWQDDLDTVLQFAEDKVTLILEGSGQGDVGIYNEAGNPRLILVAYLLQQFRTKLQRVIIEAPTEAQQRYWLALFGWDIPLGNTALDQQSRIVEKRINFLKPAVAARVQQTRDAVFAMAARAVDQLSRTSGGADQALDITYDLGDIVTQATLVDMYPD